MIADLHRHLDGSLRRSTVIELANKFGVVVPSDLPFYKGMGLAAALSRFAFTLSLLQKPNEVKRIASEMCEDAEAEGVSTLEIRFAPQLHNGACIEEIVDAAILGANKRAGIILCGLYGESPDVLFKLVEVAKCRPNVVGIDLAGGPAPFHQFKMEDYSGPFSKARDLGIGRTVHAGEGRDAKEIIVAINKLHATRIGHGTTLLDNKEALDLVLKKGVTIEACITSNMHVGAIGKTHDHQISKWLDYGVKAAICADNTLLSATTAREELLHVQKFNEMNEQKIKQLIQNGHQARFQRT